MVSIEALDQNLIELKLALPKDTQDVQLDCYFFVPKILDLSEYTYPTELFYRHLHNEQYLYTDGISLNNEPFRQALSNLAQQEYKSARHYRRNLSQLCDKVIRAVIVDIEQITAKNTPDQNLVLVEMLIDNLNAMAGDFRESQPQNKSLIHHFRYVDEYLNWKIQQAMLKLLSRRSCLSESSTVSVSSWVKVSEEYAMEQGYRLCSLQPLDKKLTRRLYLLKDYINRYRLLDSNRRRKGVLVEQGVFSMAAFTSMAIATIIAFATQQAFGNFTTPFFFALTFSYILKDRFKELSRNYVFKRIMSRRCQFEYRITDPLDHWTLATMKDGCSFVSQKDLPEAIKKAIHGARKVNRNRREDVLYYKKRYNMKNNKKIEHSYHGVKDKILINIQKMLRNIPEESQTVYILDSDVSTEAQLEKNQIIYMVVGINNQHHKVMTLWVNSKGISHCSVSS
ncbi:hypothetical protein [Vibrio mediterranei]|uniref:hypothetical protein n=1 Tax=Vibrio mediterranei TaxID=689 RepID=UPI0022835BC8|nr:hypothetical protein [Vibrio mediterranei]MCY9852635.1 hypothetical protein [Vibrio mediterranei]